MASVLKSRILTISSLDVTPLDLETYGLKNYVIYLTIPNVQW